MLRDREVSASASSDNASLGDHSSSQMGMPSVDYDKGRSSATATGKMELGPIPRKISLNHSSNPECSLGHTPPKGRKGGWPLPIQQTILQHRKMVPLGKTLRGFW